jgi:hypothetical protein
MISTLERAFIYICIGVFMWSFTSFGQGWAASLAGGWIIGMGLAIYITRNHID